MQNRAILKNYLEDSDLSGQEWSEGEGITVIASQAPPLETPPTTTTTTTTPRWGRLGVERWWGVSDCRSCGLWLLRLYDAPLFVSRSSHCHSKSQTTQAVNNKRGTENKKSHFETGRKGKTQTLLVPG